MATFSRIIYRRGLLRGLSDTASVREKVLLERDIPDWLVQSIIENGISGMGGTYGDPDAGEPIEYDYIRLEHQGEPVEITFYNRSITLFETEDERVRCFDRVCSQLMEIPGSKS